MRGPQRRPGRVAITPAPGEPTEAEMAVPLQRAHAELHRQRQGFAVVLLGPVPVGVISDRPHVAEELERIRFVPALALFLGEVDGLDGEQGRALGSPDHEVRFRQADEPEGMIRHQLHGDRPLHRLLEEWQGVVQAPEADPCRAQRGGHEGPCPADRLTGIGAEPSFQDRRGALDLSLEHEDRSEADARDDEAVRRIPRLGDM